MKKKIIAVIVTVLVVVIGIIIWQQTASAPSLSSNEQSNVPSGDNQKKLTNTDTSEQTSFDKKQYSTTDPSSPWVVVNKQHPLNPLNYTPSDLTSVGNGQFMRAEAATALQQMLDGAKAAGFTITAASGYRSYQTQISVYNSEVKSYGQAVADSESARPGYSEHQTGWAMDLASDGCSITDCFGDTPGGKWIDANAYKYGFILRYTPSDTSVTGYRAEAWHFRYIGTTLSEELHKQNVPTLEQFFGISGGATYKN